MNAIASSAATLLTPAPPSESQRTQALAQFLRARRESIDPARVGLARSTRRRTPGLRREEVAELACIGTTWYTWLEQGRAIQVSSKALSAIATALLCSEAETRHLFFLAGLGAPTSLTHPICEQLSSAAQILLDQLDPLPALIQNARFDIIGFNRAYCRLINVDLREVAPEDRNCIYLALTHQAWRDSIADWQETMPRMVAFFRAAMAEHLGDPVWEARLQSYLSVSDAFRETWERYEVRGVENHIKRFRHPHHGVLSLQQSNWWSAPKNGDRLLVYVALDTQSRQILQQLAQDDPQQLT
jgi:transcriptional regulator with XRE-family HTH domain